MKDRSPQPRTRITNSGSEAKRGRSLPFCYREAPYSLPSASRTSSVPWCPVAVTWFPLRQHISKGPSAHTVYSHDMSGKSTVYPPESGAGAWWASMTARERSGGGRDESCATRPLGVSLCWICAVTTVRSPKLAVTKYSTSADGFQNKKIRIKKRVSSFQMPWKGKQKKTEYHVNITRRILVGTCFILTFILKPLREPTLAKMQLPKWCSRLHIEIFAL